MTEDEMVGWHHQLNGHEFEQALGEGNGNPLQYSYLENPMDGGAWCAPIHRVTNSWTRLRTEL